MEEVIMNKVILLGRIGKIDAHEKFTSFSLATTSRDAKNEEVTQWHQVVVFGKTAENLQKYADKGLKILVEGELQYRIKDNVKYASILCQKLEFVEFKKDTQGSKKNQNTNDFDTIYPF